MQDLNGNGSPEIAALTSTGDLYTFDGPTRVLRNLEQQTALTLLSSRPNPSELIASDDAGTAHFLRYADDSYTESMTRQLSTVRPAGIHVLSGDELWTGASGVLTLRLPPNYNRVKWQSGVEDDSFGRFVATENHNGQGRVFASSAYSVSA